jgi:DNA-directed RNA polymerase specialized sigma24 family protein
VSIQRLRHSSRSREDPSAYRSPAQCSARCNIVFVREADEHVDFDIPPGARVADVLSALKRSHDRTWPGIAALVTRAASRGRRSLRGTGVDADDLAQTVCLRVLNDDFAVLRRSQAATTFRAYLAGIVDVVRRELTRAEARSRAAGRSVADAEDRRSARQAARIDGLRGYTRAEFATLTPRQQEFLDRYVHADSTAEVGRSMGVHRESARDGVSRARRALDRAHLGVARPARGSLPDVASLPGRTPTNQVRRMVSLWNAGQSRAETARALGTTEAIVHSALQRLRRRGRLKP